MRDGLGVALFSAAVRPDILGCRKFGKLGYRPLPVRQDYDRGFSGKRQRMNGKKKARTRRAFFLQRLVNAFAIYAIARYAGKVKNSS